MEVYEKCLSPRSAEVIDDATLAEWEQDIEQALRPSSLQQGAMWTGAMAGHLREAIAEIRRLREVQACSKCGRETVSGDCYGWCASWRTR